MASFAFSLINHYGSAAACVLLALEYIGLPFPGEPIMSMLGFINSNNVYEFIASIFLCVFGTFLGSLIAFFIGFKIGEPMTDALCNFFHISKANFERDRAKFENNQALIIIFSRFIPGFRHIVPYLSGIVKINIHKYIIINLISSVIWCVFFLFCGLIFKNFWTKVDVYVRIVSLIILLVIIIAYFIFKIVQHKRKPRANNKTK